LDPHTQAQAQKTEGQTDVAGTAQTVATFIPVEDRSVDRQADIQTAHQSQHRTLLEAPLPYVRPYQSGLTPHALETYSETSSQLSEDPTVDSIVQELSAEDAGSDITDTDTYSRGPGEEQPAFPGLTLSVTGATSHGADQGLDLGDPPLEPRTLAESRPQAVDLVYPDSQNGTRGAGHSTHF